MTFIAETQRSQSKIFFDLVVRGHQIKRSKPVGVVRGRRPGIFVELVSPNSTTETLLLSELGASNESLLGRVGGES